MANISYIDKWTSSRETLLAVKDEKKSRPDIKSGGSETVCNIFNSSSPEKMALAQLNCKVHSGKQERIELKIGDDIIDISDIQQIYNSVVFKLMQYTSERFRPLNDYKNTNVSISDPITFLNDQMRKYNEKIKKINDKQYKNEKIISKSNLTLFINNSKIFLEDCLCYSDCISYYICHCYGNCNYY